MAHVMKWKQVQEVGWAGKVVQGELAWDQVGITGEV